MQRMYIEELTDANENLEYIKNNYADKYNFMMSLQDGLAEIEEY